MAEADPSREIAGAGAVVVDRSSRRTRWRRWLLMVSLPLLLIAVGTWFWLTSGQTISTDNARVRQDVVSVSSDVGGRIVAVAVHENQIVKAGDLLFRVDPAPYHVALGQADAALATAQVKVLQLQTDYASTGADIDSARSNVDLAQSDFDRQSALKNQGFTTAARLQQAQNTLEVARAELRNKIANAAKARVALATGAQVPGVNPMIATAQALRAQAALNLSRTEIRAPFSGRVSQTNRLQVGAMMIQGLPALSIVANDRSWVEANFKESQFDQMHVGQRATIHVDAYPELELRGHVESIGSGTGSEFAILPTQNANGNWVKVTQRIPVRIAVDTRSPRPLIAGMSVDVTIYVRDGAR